jgi:Flavinator of succinate dehydrogenase
VYYEETTGPRAQALATFLIRASSARCCRESPPKQAFQRRNMARPHALLQRSVSKWVPLSCRCSPVLVPTARASPVSVAPRGVSSLFAGSVRGAFARRRFATEGQSGDEEQKEEVEYVSLNDLLAEADEARTSRLGTHLDVDTLRRRCLYNARERGMKESDMILGLFAEEHLKDLSETEVRQFDALLQVCFPRQFPIVTDCFI